MDWIIIGGGLLIVIVLIFMWARSSRTSTAGAVVVTPPGAVSPVLVVPPPPPAAVAVTAVGNAVVDVTKTLTGCDGSSPVVDCGTGVIKSGSVKYGRWNNSACPHPTVNGSTPPRWG